MKANKGVRFHFLGHKIFLERELKTKGQGRGGKGEGQWDRGGVAGSKEEQTTRQQTYTGRGREETDTLKT